MLLPPRVQPAPLSPPSCADTAAPRCSSSRPSRALSTSVGRRGLRSNHDRHRINQQNLYGSILQNHAAANARGLVLQNAPFSARASLLERTLPTRPWLATNTQRSRSTDDPRLTGFCPRSNPHSAAPLLISSARPRGFLPGGLSNTCPQASPGLDSSARSGRCRTTLNPSPPWPPAALRPCGSSPQQLVRVTKRSQLGNPRRHQAQRNPERS